MFVVSDVMLSVACVARPTDNVIAIVALLWRLLSVGEKVAVIRVDPDVPSVTVSPEIVAVAVVADV